MKRKISIKDKVISLIVLMIVSISICLGISSSEVAKKMATKTSLKSIEQSVSLLNENINSLTNNTEKLIDTIISSGYLKSTMTDEDEKNLSKYYENLSKIYPEIENFIFIQPRKYHIYPYTDKVGGYIPCESSLWDEMINAEDAYWKDAYIDAATGKWIITYTKKIFDGDELIGFAELDVSLEHIINMINEIKLEQSGYIMITDYSGNIKISKDDSLIEQDIANEKLLEMIASNEKGSITYDEDNKKQLAVFSVLDSAIEWKAIGIVPYKEALSEYYTLLGKVIRNSVFIGIVGIVIAILFSNKLIKRINEFGNNLKVIGEGNLIVSCDIKSNDEIEEMAGVFNSVVSNLASLIKNTKKSFYSMSEGFGNLSNIAQQTINSSKEITDSIEVVAAGSYEQAKETSEIVDNFNKLSNAMKGISSSINEVNELFVKTEKINKQGLEVVSNLLVTTDKTNKSTEAVKDVINEISISSLEIDNIVQTINSIAEQTNLLALNASIEAARAGELGKGFAVVADEVRKLAEQSASSTSEIQQVIDKVKKQTSSAVKEMEIAEESVQLQTNAVKETGESFNGISAAIDNLSQNVNNIGVLNSNMIEIKDRVEEIVKRLSQKAKNNSQLTEEISDVTEEQLAIMNEMASIIAELTDYVENLNDEIDMFKTE